MCLKVGSGRSHELGSLKLEALGLEAGDDLADKASLDAVRLDHDVSALHICKKNDLIRWLVCGQYKTQRAERCMYRWRSTIQIYPTCVPANLDINVNRNRVTENVERSRSF